MLWFFLLSFLLLLISHLLIRFETEVENKLPAKKASTLLGVNSLAGLLFAFICGGFISNMMVSPRGYYIVNGIKWSEVTSRAFDQITATILLGAICSAVAMGISYAVKALYDRRKKKR